MQDDSQCTDRYKVFNSKLFYRQGIDGMFPMNIRIPTEGEHHAVRL